MLGFRIGVAVGAVIPGGYRTQLSGGTVRCSSRPDAITLTASRDTGSTPNHGRRIEPHPDPGRSSQLKNIHRHSPINPHMAHCYQRSLSPGRLGIETTLRPSRTTQTGGRSDWRHGFPG
ncbi:hypothetical protein ABVT39_024122 [Epinephelus coioides]